MRLVTRTDPSLAWTALCYGLAVVAFLLGSGLLVASIGGSPITAFRALAIGAFGGASAIGGTLAKSAPLILTGLSAAIAYRARIWSIGQEGQVIAGAILAYGAARLVGPAGPSGTLVVLTAGMLGGALPAVLAAEMKTRARVDIVISTVLLDYVVGHGLTWVLQPGLWGEVGQTVSYQQSARVDASLMLAHLPGLGKAHVGVIVALLAVGVVWLLVTRSRLGFEIRNFGLNPRTMISRGVDTGRLTLVVMAISGALAGLAGAGELLAEAQRLKPDALAGLGYTGIVVALIGRNGPLGALAAALFFGALSAGGLYMKITADVPAALVTAMQGLALILFLVADVASRMQPDPQRPETAS